MKYNNKDLKYKALKRIDSMCTFGTSKYAFKEQAKRKAQEIPNKTFFIVTANNIPVVVTDIKSAIGSAI